MCFSATASFAAAATLSMVGVYGLVKAIRNNPRFICLLSIPLFFGIQQFIEGITWLQLQNNQMQHAQMSAYLYLFFAFFFWPSFIPLSVLLVEKKPSNKRILKALFVVGTLLGCSLYLSILANIFPMTVSIMNHSIRYATLLPDVLNDLGMYIYCSIIVFSLALSSLPPARFFAFLVFIAIFISLYFYYYTFTSVWCFFSALVSAFVFIIALRLPKRK